MNFTCKYMPGRSASLGLGTSTWVKSVRVLGSSALAVRVTLPVNCRCAVFLAVDDGVLAGRDRRGEDLGHVDEDAERIGLHEMEQGPRSRWGCRP